ncbi:MAG: hypothetical protein ACLTXI_00075 [Collinsella sp.]
MDVLNAIRFLQGKRVPTSGESSRRRATRGSGAKSPATPPALCLTARAATTA